VRSFLPQLLLGVLVTVVTLIGFLIIRRRLEQARENMRRRLATEEGAEDGTLLEELEANKPPTDWLGRLDRSFNTMIERTGLKMTANEALSLMTLAGAVLAALLYFWKEELWFIILGLVVGCTIPLAIFLFLQRRWRRKLQDQMPDAFFLLARSLRAGLSLEQALDLVGEHGPQPLAKEFQRCAQQCKLGLAVATALQLTANRIQLTDFNVFVSVITLQATTGGNLPFLLDRVAITTRDRNQLRSQIRAATALGRITGTVLAAATPTLLLGYLLWQPDHVETFFHSAPGLSALAVAMTLEVIGVIWIYFLLRVE
jgi:tight adherence protein B